MIKSITMHHHWAYIELSKWMHFRRIQRQNRVRACMKHSKIQKVYKYACLLASLYIENFILFAVLMFFNCALMNYKLWLKLKRIFKNWSPSHQLEMSIRKYVCDIKLIINHKYLTVYLFKKNYIRYHYENQIM